jgi:PIN domain nuclease of toxin-antitoxin system
MRILLDTHVWLWMNAEPERLSSEALRLVQDLSNELFLSAASAWEIALKGWHREAGAS